MTKVMIIFLIIIAGIIAGLVLFLRLAPQFGASARDESLAKIKRSPNWRDGRFINLTPTTLQSPDGSMLQATGEYFKRGAERTPKTAPPIIKINPQELASVNRKEVRITWLGHSSVLIQIDGKTLLTDPMFGRWASPVPFLGPKRFNDDLPLPPEQIPHLDAILLSHDHYDHLDYGTIKKLHPKTDRFFVPLGVGAHLRRWGVPVEKITELDWWGESEFDGLRLVATPSRHFSGRGISGRNRTLWCSWAIIGTKKIYFGADSGYGPHFKEIGEKFGSFDLTMLENGAYSQYWPFVHMMPEQTAQAHVDLKGDTLLPIHWAQFNLSLHAWTEPIERLLARAEEKNLAVVTPKIGEPFNLKKNLPDSRWWKN